jgi:hypothetical protein
MTRTVEEAAEACLDAISTPDTLRTEARPHLLAALREARDAALEEAADHLDRIAPYAEDQQTTFTAQGCAREVRLLASSPPPAAAERGLRERVEGAVDRIENLLGALAIPMPDRLQVKGIRGSLPSIRDDLRAALREEETR